MRAVAKRLVGGPSATAKPGLGSARHRAPGSGTDFERAIDPERPVGLRGHFDGAVAHGKRRRFLRCGLAGSLEFLLSVAAVAERLVTGRSASAQRGAMRGAVPFDRQISMKCQRTVFADADDVDRGRCFVVSAIESFERDGSGRAVARNLGYAFG